MNRLRITTFDRRIQENQIGRHLLKKPMRSELGERKDLILPSPLQAAVVGDLKALHLAPQGLLQLLQELPTLMAIFHSLKLSLRLPSH